MKRTENRNLPEPLDHDSVWSFIAGADEQQLRLLESRTGYELRLWAAADSQGTHSLRAALHRSLSIQNDEELGAEHEHIANAVNEIVHGRWEVETLSFHAGATVPTYQRLEWLE